MEKKQRFNLSYILMAVLGVLVLQNLLMAQFRPQVIPYSEFVQAVGQDRVKEISIGTTAIHGKMRDDQGGEIIFKTVRVDNDLAAKLSEREVKYSGQIENTFFKTLFSWLIPISIFYLIWFFLMRRMQAGPAGMMTLGKNKAKLVGEHGIETRFADVAGADEAKEELNEVRQILAQQETRVTQLVTDKKATLIAVAKALLEKEVLMEDEFKAMVDAGMAQKDAPV